MKIIIINSDYLYKIASSPEEIFNILIKENPSIPQDSIKQVSNSTNNTFTARWLLKNVVMGPSGLNGLNQAIQDLRAFDKIKVKLKSNGLPTDIGKYNYESLKETLNNQNTLQKSKTEQKSTLPNELIKMITVIGSKALRNVPDQYKQIEKNNIFNWMSRLFERTLKSSQTEDRFEDMKVFFYNTNPTTSKEKYNEYLIKKILPEFLEDKINYISMLQDFYLWKYSNPQTEEKQKASYFNFNKGGLSDFNDTHLNQAQKEVKYNIDEKAAEGLEIITEGSLKAIKVTEWNDHFAEELCKAANWCIRDKRAFDDYNIGPDNPVFLISEGNRQLAMCGFESGQIKDVNDNPIDEKLAEKIYPLIKKLAKKYSTTGMIPLEDDFYIFYKNYKVKEDYFKNLIDTYLTSLLKVTEIIDKLRTLYRERYADFNIKIVEYLTNKYKDIINLIKDSNEVRFPNIKFDILRSLQHYRIIDNEEVWETLKYLLYNTKSQTEFNYFARIFLENKKIPEQQILNMIFKFKDWQHLIKQKYNTQNGYIFNIFDESTWAYKDNNSNEFIPLNGVEKQLIYKNLFLFKYEDLKTRNGQERNKIINEILTNINSRTSNLSIKARNWIKNLIKTS